MDWISTGVQESQSWENVFSFCLSFMFQPSEHLCLWWWLPVVWALVLTSHYKDHRGKKEEKILLSKNKTWRYVINLYGSIKSFYLGISREKTHIFDNVRFCTIFQRRPDKNARCFLICFYMASLLCSSCRLLTFFFINSYYY